jgi:hypothetical protein
MRRQLRPTASFRLHINLHSRSQERGWEGIPSISTGEAHANRIIISVDHIHTSARRMRQRRHDRPVDISFHACERAVERTSFDPAQVHAMIEHGVAIVLPWTAVAATGARTYHLLYDCRREDFVVAVVARNKRDRSRLHIVTVLTREQVEPDRGPLPVRHPRMAARRAMGPVAFREWERVSTDGRMGAPHYRIESFYRCDATPSREQRRPGRMTFYGAPVCPRIC